MHVNRENAMIVREHAPLSTRTTFRTGGEARYVLEARTIEEVREALLFAHERKLRTFVLGDGSNVLASDRGFDGAVILPKLSELSIEGTTLVAGAGIAWDALVREAAARNLWGLENLAGIPGTVGAAPIQNIGAYGSEVKDVIAFVDALRIEDGEMVRIENADCGFGYRDSRFKREGGYVIHAVGFMLTTEGAPDLSYPDVVRAKESGVPLRTPQEVGDAIRTIRAGKFPDLGEFGTAGSFFKNPVVSEAVYAELRAQMPDLPGYPVSGGIKISLAHVLDKGLALRGHRVGSAWLYDKQPLVVVLDAGGTAHDVDALAEDVVARVHEFANIRIEREVRSLA